MLSDLRFLVSRSQFKVSALVSLTLLSIYSTLSSRLSDTPAEPDLAHPIVTISQ